MRCLKLTLAYDGTNYVGWQRQPDGVSIQQLVEDACAPLAQLPAGEAPAVAGAGRTDAGVHARGQVASVHLPTTLPPETLLRALNFRLPEDVRVVAVDDAAEGFHARFHATGKRYRYRVVTAQVRPPFDRWFVWHAPDVRDVDAMRRAAASLIGTHDFASFQGTGSETSDTIRTVRRLDICDAEGQLVMDVEGDGFLRHMVRAMVGTLADVGAGRRAPESMAGVLAAKDRRAAGQTAPASGLTLMEVFY
jgi:tRNA pseudouridine38-40 synthase